MSTFSTIVGVSLLIILHELGHFWAARLCKMRVIRFSVGFGPKLVGKQWGETYFQIAAIPFGGYVLIDGLGPPPENAPLDPGNSSSFNTKAYWQRALTLLAGPLMNWLVAVLLIFCIALTVGFQQPNLQANKIGEISPNGVAARAGIKPHDIILSINNAPIRTWPELVKAIRTQPQNTIPVKLLRGEQLLTIELTPQKSPRGNYGVIGVGPSYQIKRFGLVGSIRISIHAVWNMFKRTTSLLWSMIRGSEEAQLSGIPGIIEMVSQQAQGGFGQLLEALASLSVGLCLLNLLPFPALDGGRLALVALEVIRRRPLPERFELILNGIGFILLFGLMIFVSIRDIIQ